MGVPPSGIALHARSTTCSGAAPLCLRLACIPYSPSFYPHLLDKRPDTVGEPPSSEIGVLNIPSLKAKKLRKLPREKSTLRTLKEVRQQYPPISSTGHAGAAHPPQRRVETHSINQCTVRGWGASFWNTGFAPGTRQAGAATSFRARRAFSLVCSVPPQAYRHGTGTPSSSQQQCQEGTNKNEENT
jgi:hypothetical protein